VQVRGHQLSVEHKATQLRNKLIGKQAIVAAQPHEPSRHEPVLEVERILIVDFTTTQARAKGAALSANREGGQTETAVAKPPNALPPPFADGVDRLYHQLAETHTIATAPLVECACWRRSDPTSSPIHVRAGWQRLAAARTAPPPPTDFSPKLHSGNGASVSNPKHAQSRNKC
jgi:hypothetical protein